MEKEIIRKLKSKLDRERFVHSLNVADTAGEMAAHYDADIPRARIAGILHDCARYLSPEEFLNVAAENNINVGTEEAENPALLHAPVGLIIARKCYNIEDERVLQAIAAHTFGFESMTTLDKIIYLADKVEPGRCFSGLDVLRELAYKDLDGALLWHFDYTITHLVRDGKTIHPQSVRTRNSLLRKFKKSIRGSGLVVKPAKSGISCS